MEIHRSSAFGRGVRSRLNLRSEWRHRSCQLNRRTPGATQAADAARAGSRRAPLAHWAFKPNLVLAYSRVLSDGHAALQLQLRRTELAPRTELACAVVPAAYDLAW